MASFLINEHFIRIRKLSSLCILTDLSKWGYMIYPSTYCWKKKNTKTCHPAAAFRHYQEQIKNLPEYTNMLLFYFLRSKPPSVGKITLNVHASISKRIKRFLNRC